MFRHYRVIHRQFAVSTLPSYTSMSNALVSNIIYNYFLYNDQQMHNYFTNYHTPPTCFDTNVSSTGSLQSVPCQVTQVCQMHLVSNIIYNYFLYNDQQKHNYFTNYHTHLTCFDTIVSSSGSSQSVPCQVTPVCQMQLSVI